jgi:hypothetical protein
MRRFGPWAVAVLIVMLVSGTASAQTKTFTATLSGAAEVPPSSSAGTGTATVTLDPSTKTITWKVTYSGMTGPVMAAHIHGPAGEATNGTVMLPLKGSMGSPIEGSATLTDSDIADLESGGCYVNLHTRANPGGEIRGQLRPGSR